jgi:response regulator RpfG family c-di-GMP phosphodiesterase
LNDKILFVDSSPEALRGFEKQLGPDHDVTLCRGAAEALERLRTQGGFAVIVSGRDLDGRPGSALLADVHVEWPDCVPILMTAAVDVDVVIEAIHAGRIYRFLERPCPSDRLREVIREALLEHQGRRDARRRAVELDFSSRVLTDFNGRLEELISEQTTSLMRLHRYVSDLNSCHSLDEIARATADSVREVCPERGVFIELWDGSSTGLRCHVLDGPELSPERHVQTVQTADGPLGSIVVSDGDSRDRRLTRTQRAMLASMAASCAVAAHNQIRRRERDEAQHATILALAKLAERRDNETGKHLERVSLYCKLIAEGLRADGRHLDLITDSWIEDLVRSAPLHDIGKVGIPDRILMKPGQLGPDEWSVMQTHTQIGAETLRAVAEETHAESFLEMSIDIAASHHEKWDGSGYPARLSGERIPLSARILALADVYDALTSRRPYKEPWTHEQSMSWILEGAGSHFDPDVVEAFAARAEKANAIRERLADDVHDLEAIGLKVA